MKKLLIIAMLLASTAAYADNSVAQPGGTPPAAGSGQSGGPEKGERFDQMKARVLERIQKHLAEVQQKQSCVQAATTPEALKACLPHMGERREGGEGGEGRGGGFGGGRFNHGGGQQQQGGGTPAPQ